MAPAISLSIVGSLRDREGSVLGLRPPSLEFRILCLEDSVISFIYYPQEVLLAKFSLYVHKGGLKPDSFHFSFAISLLCIDHDSVKRKNEIR